MLHTLLLLSVLQQGPAYDRVPEFVGLRAVTELNGQHNNKSPTLTEDELTIVWASDRSGGAGGYDLYMARRAHVEATFGAPIALGQVNSAGNDDAPQLSYDGLTVFFSSDRAGSLGHRDLYSATRRSHADSFGVAVNLGAGVNGAGLRNDDPHPTQDGNTLFFRRHDPILNKDQLYTSSRDASGAFGSAIPFAPGNDPASNQVAPCPNANGHSVYFLSDRPGGPSAQNNYWMTSYDAPSASWTVPSPIPSLTPPGSGSMSGGWRGGNTQNFYYTRYILTWHNILCICPKTEVVWVEKCIVSKIHRSNCRWKWIPPGFEYDYTYTWPVVVKFHTIVTKWYDWRQNLQQGFGMLFASPPMPVTYNGIQVPGFNGAFLLDPGLFLTLAYLVPHQNGLVTVPLPIPGDRSLVGARLDLQAVTIDATFTGGSFSMVSAIEFTN